MAAALYLFLGVALIGALFYALTQITARQRRLNAELLRLERLAAEVSMSAEAVFDQIDARLDHLQRAVSKGNAEAGAETKLEAKVEMNVAATVERPAAPVAVDRYRETRARVWALADQGKTELETAKELGVPRGEVRLILNLRRRKGSA